ncbi:MAG: nucleotide sugar dehydrogenase [Bacteroidetes bacterium]|nr:nucleotide sugar dehydrogenase [Bacteroidota bacterium]
MENKIGIIGLGYVGLPLAVEFGKKFKTVGFDINSNRIMELKNGVDNTLEVDSDNLKSSKYLEFTNEYKDIEFCNFYIVTVPTPVDNNNRPDLKPLLGASETIGKVLKKGDIVVYESTVYPGVTEDKCVPVLEKVSGLKFNIDFFCGYSPERINPGDKEHTVTKILKITSGSTPQTAEKVDNLYKTIITAGTHKAPSIKVAEAAKVIENSQRDINIAFINELAKIFHTLGIDTNEVLEAAGTKWNFLKFKPGLVGGHCIGVDPFYLAQKAQEAGYNPEIILAGRRLNDSMGQFIAEQVVKLILKKGIKLNNARCLILGFTFKENCPDVRNTKVIDIVNELKTYSVEPVVYDPRANAQEVKMEYGIEINNTYPTGDFEAIILAVAHNEFLNLPIEKSSKTVVYDVKAILPLNKVDARL